MYNLMGVCHKFPCPSSAASLRSCIIAVTSHILGIWDCPVCVAITAVQQTSVLPTSVRVLGGICSVCSWKVTFDS